MMRNWLPAIAGFVFGAAVGLYYSWVFQPVKYVDTAPSSLRRDFQEDYFALIASAFATSGDTLRAQARLALLPDPDPAQSLAALAQRRLAEGYPQSEVLAMAELAEALRPAIQDQVSLGPSPTAPAVEITALPSPSSTTRPTLVATATPGAPFELTSRVVDCDNPRLLEIFVFDAAEEPVPGVEVVVIWDTGQDHFFTGLKPEISIGYGDFEMQKETVYSLHLSGADQPVTDLSVPECADDEGQAIAGSWLLNFVQP
jgi:hypothetical protein